MAGNINPKSLQNLRPENGFGVNVDPIAAQQKANESRKRKGILKNVILNSLEFGEITYEDIGKTVIKEAKEGKSWAVEMIYEMSENFQNRKLKIQQKETKIKEDILEHFKKIQIVDSVEEGEVIPYEELNRSID